MIKNTTTLISMVTAKMAETQGRIDELKTGDVSENTKRTQTFKLRRDLKMMNIILDLLSDEDVNEDDFKSIFTLTEQRKQESVVVQKGDKITDLLQKYADKRDLMTKLTKACESAGLTMNYQTGFIE